MSARPRKVEKRVSLPLSFFVLIHRRRNDVISSQCDYHHYVTAFETFRRFTRHNYRGRTTEERELTADEHDGYVHLQNREGEKSSNRPLRFSLFDRYIIIHSSHCALPHLYYQQSAKKARNNNNNRYFRPKYSYVDAVTKCLYAYIHRPKRRSL